MLISTFVVEVFLAITRTLSFRFLFIFALSLPLSLPPSLPPFLSLIQIGDAEITSSIQSYATPGRMSAYLTEHVGSHWLRLVSSRAFRDWAKGRPHQFLSFVSARYDNVAVTVKLYEYETAGAKGASVGKSPGGTFAPAPSPPPKQKKARKGGEGSAGREAAARGRGDSSYRRRGVVHLGGCGPACPESGSRAARV